MIGQVVFFPISRTFHITCLCSCLFLVCCWQILEVRRKVNHFWGRPTKTNVTESCFHPYLPLSFHLSSSFLLHPSSSSFLLHPSSFLLPSSSILLSFFLSIFFSSISSFFILLSFYFVFEMAESKMEERMDIFLTEVRSSDAGTYHFQARMASEDQKDIPEVHSSFFFLQLHLLPSSFFFLLVPFSCSFFLFLFIFCFFCFVVVLIFVTKKNKKTKKR